MLFRAFLPIQFHIVGEEVGVYLAHDTWATDETELNEHKDRACNPVHKYSLKHRDDQKI